MKKIFYAKNEIDKTVLFLKNSLSTKKVVCFTGPMGSGKTTLIKALVTELGESEQGSSPSFGIVNEYHHRDGSILGYHFDFYRLNDPTEALDLGLEDYLNKDVWVFIEWPEKIADLLPEDCHNIRLQIIDPTTRELVIEC